MSIPDDLEVLVCSYARSRRLGAILEARWLAWSRNDAAGLLDVAQALGLGANHVADIMGILEEIAAREETSPAAVLGDPGIRGIFAAPIGRSDKLKRLKAVLRERRYPRLTVLAKALEGEVRALDLGDDIKVRFPPALAGDEVTVELRARRPESLRDAVERLHDAVKGGGFERLFALLDESV